MGLPGVRPIMPDAESSTQQGIVRDFEGEAQALLRLGLRGDRLNGNLHLVPGFELGAAVGAVAFCDLGEPPRDQFAQLRIGAEDTLQFHDFLPQGVTFCFEFQAGSTW